MKHLLLVVYVLAVLLFAGFSRANDSNQLPIDSAEYDQQHNLLYLSGLVFNSCITEAQPVIGLDASSENRLQLHVVSSSNHSVCIPVVNGRFQMAFDVRSLGGATAGLNLQDGHTYDLHIQGTNLELNLTASAVSGFGYSSASAKGTIVQLEPEVYGLEVSPDKIILVQNPFIDWSEVLGQFVTVAGHQLHHQLPIFNTLLNSTPSLNKKLVTDGHFFATGVTPTTL